MWVPTSSAELLRVENLGVQRGTRWILRELSFGIGPGEALGVLGPSGSGKSTLAWAILGLLPLAEGRIHLGGLPWSRMAEGQRRPHRPLIQAVFQDAVASLPPHRRGWEILEEPLRIHGRGNARQMREAAAEMAQRVAFPVEALEQKPPQWSGGLAQRLCLARALMLAPRLLVLDEPLAALDPILGSQILHLLAGLKAKGLGLLFISHQLPPIQQLCEHTLLMAPGRAAPG